MTSQNLLSRAQVVIVGGGVIGTAIAYQLTRLGWTDVVVLEKNTLTSGTTWHAAGLITQARPTHGMRQIVKRSLDIFRTLEQDTGFATGYVETGTVHIAMTDDRMHELKHQHLSAVSSEIEAQLLTPAETIAIQPLLNPEGLCGGLFYPREGRGNATDTTIALARGATQRGARVMEHIDVLEVLTKDGSVSGVRTNQGDIEAEIVVNATGMWGREFGAKSGVSIPLQALAHYYIVTDGIENLPRNLPTIKSADDCSYVKDEAGALLVGFFEPGSYAWKPKGIPPNPGFIRLPEDWDHLGPFYERMIERVPILQEAGIKLHFSGPESFTTDGHYHLGPAPTLKNYFVAAGFNSTGFLSGPGAGATLADWIVSGKSPIDLPETDLARVQRHESNPRFVVDRVLETLDISYSIHWPFEQRSTARPLRQSPLHELTEKAGAVFGEMRGWERANWYARHEGEREYTYSFGRPCWFDAVKEEHDAVRTAVGMFDTSSFGKLLVQGRDALKVLQRVSIRNIDVTDGRIVYTQWLNKYAGIESDVTVTRLANDRFLVLSGPATVTRDCAHLENSIEGDEICYVTDITGNFAMLSVMGPNSREFLQSLTETDLSHEAFPFATSREIDLGFGFVRANRLTFVGELGWELLVPADISRHIFTTLLEHGGAFGLRMAGYYALNSLRLEKAYRSWGHDIGANDNPIEAGLDFAIAWDKPGGFIGHEALSRARESGVSRRLVQLLLSEPKTFLFHDEPIYRDGVLVGKVDSTQFGYTLGAAVILSWISGPENATIEFFTSGDYQVQTVNGMVPASVSLRPMYDPGSERVRC